MAVDFQCLSGPSLRDLKVEARLFWASTKYKRGSKSTQKSITTFDYQRQKKKEKEKKRNAQLV